MKVLIANRGEIAMRILRSCRELDFPTVAIYSDADRDALHRRYADESVYIGPAAASESYLNIENIMHAAIASGAEAIHPGYGFLSENAAFAKTVEEAGLIFIGPTPETIALTGDKLAARQTARKLGIPVLPGPDTPLRDEIPYEMLEKVKFPVLIKAVSGGGGRGIRLASNSEEMELMIQSAREEAKAAFGDETVYFEPLVQQARHIEIQIIGDGMGRVLCLGERECSIQRRRQKLIEESPAPSLSPKLRQNLYDAAIKLGKALNYRSLGTIEFLLDDTGSFFFIEVNPRIQVEHPVTEMVTGIDLVTVQLRLADGQPFKYAQEDIVIRGSAIEARVLAEDPENGFLPSTGTVTYLREPGGLGVRIDSALYLGMEITTDYDSLIAKVIGWGEDRQSAIRRLRRGLMELQIGGISTDSDFIVQIIDSYPFLQGSADTTYLDNFQPLGSTEEEFLEQQLALAAAILEHKGDRTGHHEPPQKGNANFWRYRAWQEQIRSNL